MMIRHAPSFAAEMKDPDLGELDLVALAELRTPVLLTQGGASLPWFAPIMDVLADAAPWAVRVTIEEAGHAPHRTHPGEYAELLASFTHGAAV